MSTCRTLSSERLNALDHAPNSKSQGAECAIPPKGRSAVGRGAIWLLLGGLSLSVSARHLEWKKIDTKGNTLLDLSDLRDIGSVVNNEAGMAILQRGGSSPDILVSASDKRMELPERGWALKDRVAVLNTRVDGKLNVRIYNADLEDVTATFAERHPDWRAERYLGRGLMVAKKAEQAAVFQLDGARVSGFDEIADGLQWSFNSKGRISFKNKKTSQKGTADTSGKVEYIAKPAPKKSTTPTKAKPKKETILTFERKENDKIVKYKVVRNLPFKDKTMAQNYTFWRQSLGTSAYKVAVHPELDWAVMEEFKDMTGIRELSGKWIIKAQGKPTFKEGYIARDLTCVLDGSWGMRCVDTNGVERTAELYKNWTHAKIQRYLGDGWIHVVDRSVNVMTTFAGKPRYDLSKMFKPSRTIAMGTLSDEGVVPIRSDAKALWGYSVRRDP